MHMCIHSQCTVNMFILLQHVIFMKTHHDLYSQDSIESPLVLRKALLFFLNVYVYILGPDGA